VLLLAKGLPRHTLDIVAMIRLAHVFFWYDQANSRITQIIGAGEDEEMGVRRSDRSIRKDSSKQRLVEKALIFAKLKPLGG